MAMKTAVVISLKIFKQAKVSRRRHFKSPVSQTGFRGIPRGA